MNKDDLIGEDMNYGSEWECPRCHTINFETYYCDQCGYYNDEAENDDYLYKIANEDD